MRLVKQNFLSSIVKNTMFILFLVLSICSTYAQETVSDSIPPENKVTFSNIGFQYEDLISSLSQLNEKTQIPQSIILIDSTYIDFDKNLDSLKRKTFLDSTRYTLVIINSLLNEWQTYNNKYRDWQYEISKHTIKLESSRDTLRKKEKSWVNTLVIAKENDAPEFIIEKVHSAQDTLLYTLESYRTKTIKLVQLQDKMIAGIGKTEAVIAFLNESSNSLKGKLFALDSPPIWKWKMEKSTVDLYAETKANFADQERILQIFFKAHISEFLFHTLSFIFLIILFVILNRRYKNIQLPGDDIQLKMALTTLKRPVLAALTLGVVLSMYFYPGAPEIVNYTLILIILFPTLYFFPRYVQFQNGKLLIIFIFVFYIDRFQELVVVDEFLGRVFHLVKVLAAFILIYLANKASNKNPETNHKIWYHILKRLLSLFLILSVLSFITNVFGAYQLSEILIKGVLTSTLFSVIFMVTGVVASSLIVVSIRSKLISDMKVFPDKAVKFEKRITFLFYLFAALLWMKVTLTSFQLLDPVLYIYQEFVNLKWVAGSLTISVGGIVSFIMIIVITFLIARLIKELINDQIIPTKKSAKGLPNAFSMVFRYLVVTLGVYVALAAVGINLSEFGLMAGALGVGLGFGLQNILHNLVSGLIVSFERPIHVGDTVEVANLTGIVTEIGVRSSKIRTFDGSEVILPNGDLLSKQVINWTLSDQKKRLEIKIRSSYDADPHEVIEILAGVLKANDRILQTPSPMSLFEGYGDSALNFRVLFWVPLDIGLSTKSQVALSIYDKLKEKNIEAPIHQQRLLYQDSPPRNKPM